MTVMAKPILVCSEMESGICNDRVPDSPASSSDKPATFVVPADFTGDGRADLAVFIPASGAWYVYNLVDNQTSVVQFGQAGDNPVAADFDGDGRADYAVFRAQHSGIIHRPTAFGFFAIQFGQAGDLAVPADYDGDGKADVAVFRPNERSVVHPTKHRRIFGNPVRTKWRYTGGGGL